LRLAKFLGLSERYFMNLQLRYDTQKAKQVHHELYDHISTYAPTL